MKDEATANAEADRKEKERIDTINKADSMIFQTEKQLKEFGDKLPADKKAPIESALQELKDVTSSGYRSYQQRYRQTEQRFPGRFTGNVQCPGSTTARRRTTRSSGESQRWPTNQQQRQRPGSNRCRL